MDLTRRGLLLGGAVVALGGCGASGTPTPAVTSSAPTTPSGTPSGVPWAQLRQQLHGRLLRPGSSSYDELRLTPNPRFDAARPVAILRAASEADVTAGLRFAQEHRLPLALRSGGHCYAGWSAGNDRLVIDLRELSSVSMAGTAATIGAGATLAEVYDGVAGHGRALAGGSCPTVGIAGLTQGGGVGVLTRAFGLTCDALTSARVVLASGKAVTASAEEEPDLFWALCGGGGGHLGVVTSFVFDTHAAPRLSTAYLTWPFSAAAEVIPAWFAWMGAADARLWSTLKLLGGAAHPAGPSLAATVTWVGPAAGFDAQLAPLPRPSGRSTQVRGYLDAMKAYGGSGAREAFAATSHVAYVPPSSAGVTALTSAVAATPGSLQEAGISIDALGGTVGTVAPDATAFVHRRALATVQYTATYTSGGPDAAQRFVSGLRTAMTPTWGQHAYVNYADPTLADPGPAYFGDDWARLQQVRRTYDPDGLFTQPQ